MSTVNLVKIAEPQRKVGPEATAGSKLTDDLFTSLELKETRDSAALQGLFKPDGVQPQSWKYLKAAHVGISVPTVKIKSNDLGIAKGQYVLMARSRRSPIKAEHGLNFSYEFSGRAIKNEQEEYKNIEEATKAAMKKELGQEDADITGFKELAKNVSASAGSSSQIFSFYSMQVQHDSIVKLIKEFGADLDQDSGVIRINRQSDGGIIDGLELVPLKGAKAYLKSREDDKDSVAATTYTALYQLEQNRSLWQKITSKLFFWRKA